MNELLFNLFEENPGSTLEIAFANGKSDTFDYHDEDFRNRYMNSPQLFKVHSANLNDYLYINAEHITAINVIN